ncbi:MAG TPA: hypothetical protein VNQ14_09045 [Woeseiaceae bacterium]|nr:hypothetical protein [Woeseiaceae bacterium]
MSSLAAIFGTSGEKTQDSDKLLHLYWNRAELKKQFAGMRKERFKLLDRIKQQEGATARLQQKLDHLESLLIDPEWAGNAVVFYQLRGVALHCQRKLAKFAEQLKQQREQRQHNALLVKWNEERTREAKAIEHELAMTREAVQRADEQMQSERDRLMSMSGFLKIFRRRSVTATLDRLAGEIETAHEREQALLQNLEDIKNRKPPENQGLDVGSKRSINFMIFSFAQQLLLLFGDDELAAMAREASEKSVGAINYGNRQECEKLLVRVRKRAALIDQTSDVASILQQRAKMIAELALFRNDGDAVPVAGSVSTVFDIEQNGSVRRTEANLLGENYWGIAKILSR